MSTNNETRIKELLDFHVSGSVILASWLYANGVSHDLQHLYRKDGWLESIGVGAFKLTNDLINCQGGIFPLQKQIQFPIHIGGHTALSMLGVSHYVSTRPETISLFSPPKTIFPAWFIKYHWNVFIDHVSTSFLPDKLGLFLHEESRLIITLSSAERAMFLCLYLATDKMKILETYQIMSGLINFRPELV